MIYPIREGPTWLRAELGSKRVASESQSRSALKSILVIPQSCLVLSDLGNFATNTVFVDIKWYTPILGPICN